jgi:Arc/MetJ-type ribon-helix-helix transcriptional regulator
MKTITVQLPEKLVAELEREARLRKISKSDVVRERLQKALKPSRRRLASVATIIHLIGSVDGLPADLSSRKKLHLKTASYGKSRGR